jgi:hypothetical protein
MASISTVLTKWAKRALSSTPNFDIEECVTIQFGDTPLYEVFFKEVRESRGWDKIRKEFQISTVEKAQFKMIDLLNERIESIYESQMAAHSTKGVMSVCN